MVYSLKYSPYATPKPKLREENVQFLQIKRHKDEVLTQKQLLENRIKRIEQKEQQTLKKIEFEMTSVQ